MNHYWLVIQTRIGADVVQTRGGAALEVGGTVNQSRNTGVYQRASAHHARLQRDYERALAESPVANRVRGIAQRKYLGMGGRILRNFALVVAGRYDDTAAHDYGSHGNFSKGGGSSRQAQCQLHRGVVIGDLVTNDEGFSIHE